MFPIGWNKNVPSMHHNNKTQLCKIAEHVQAHGNSNFLGANVPNRQVHLRSYHNGKAHTLAHEFMC